MIQSLRNIKRKFKIACTVNWAKTLYFNFKMFPFSIAKKEIEPIYKDLKGWRQDLTQLSSYDDVSQNLKEYVQFLEQELQVPIKIVSVGPDRTQTLIR